MLIQGMKICVLMYVVSNFVYDLFKVFIFEGRCL